MSKAEGCGLAWEVTLPERGRTTPLGAKKPTGTLVIESEQRGSERIALPMAVARLLASKQKSGEVCPTTRAQLLALVDDLARSCARTRIQRLIDRREYASGEVRRKLELDGYHPQVIEACLARALEVGLVSDLRYADSYIRSKIGAGWGVLRIERELAGKGIDISDVPGWPYDYLDPEDEFGRAVELAERRRVRGPHVYEKTVRYLCGRGFSLGVATRAAQRALAADEA